MHSQLLSAETARAARAPGARALAREAITGQGAEDALGHLAARRVVRAEKQHPPLHPRATSGGAGAAATSASGNHGRVRLQKAHTDSMTGTSTSTPTTVASVAPEVRPKSETAVATASSKKLLAPISAPGAATRW